ncbi:hypothetical protein RUM44_005491 [Polyplax serrata]|uniref:EF-hand calcium-binding domain-containing protein 14 n=1 Tax=Polyplax serrata TaxID=468196 RepID=A0ABR1ADJ0_POLSC
MNSMTHVNVPLQGGKKMKKRKELDALVAKTMNKRIADGDKRSSGAGGVSSHDKLLSDSTDEQDYWTSPIGDKPRSHRRGFLLRKRACFNFLKTCSAILVFTCAVATATVMWLFVDVREQVTSLRTELNQVVAGNQGVPDALQKCHTLSKDLQKNQTYIMNRLSGFTLLLTNFSLEMTEVKSGLQAVQDQLKSSPDLVNIPRLIKDLSASVASFGSQIRDLNSTVSTLKEQNGKLDNVVVTLVSNLTETKMKLIELSNTNFGRGEVTEKMLTAEKEAILARVSQVSGNLSEINGTLNNKLKWTTDDQTKDRKLLEGLQEMNEHIEARVKTLEALCAKEAEPKFKLGSNLSSRQSVASRTTEP